MKHIRTLMDEVAENIEIDEGRMKDIFIANQEGQSAKEIAKRLKLPLGTVKKILGEEKEEILEFTDSQLDVLARQYAGLKGRTISIDQANKLRQIFNRIPDRSLDSLRRKKIPFLSGLALSRMVQKGMPVKEDKDEPELKPGKGAKIGPAGKIALAKEKDTDALEAQLTTAKGQIELLKTKLENEKNKAVKPEPNKETGEVPLTVGVAHKYLKDKQEKEKVKKEELEEVTFSPAMLSQLKKGFSGLKTLTPDKATKLNKILDKVNKDGLIDLYKSKIPFVSIGAGSVLSKKHNLSPKDINRIISKEEIQEEVELTEYFATVHSDKTQIADFIKKNKSGIDYVDDDAGGNIEFEGKGAHELADKIKSKFGVRVTKESFEPIEDKSLSLDENTTRYMPSMMKPMTVQYTYTRNPDLFSKTLSGTKTGKTLKNVGPKLKGVYVLQGKGQDHIDFLKTLNQKGIMPINKILGEELEEDTNKYITEKIKGLENKAKKSGMPYSILKKVYDRGMAAWKGGHRPGATQQQWAFARVNSFVTKSSGTWGKADKDLADKVRASKKEEVELDELQNYSRQLKDPSKEMLVVDKDGKVSVIDKSEFEKYKRQGFMAAEDIGEDGPCWKTHKQVGMKKKNGRMVPNCVPKEEVEEGFSSDAQRRAAFASGYKAKGKDKKEELDKDDKPLVKKVADMLKKASKKHASQSKMLDKAVNEADLTDKQVKMVRKVADKLPKDDFKKRYGKDADNVKFGTATNIVKKKLNIDGYEGARNLVDRLLKQERGDE